MHNKTIISAAMVAALALGAQAAQAGDVAVGVKASTLGVSGEVTTSMIPGLLNARLQVNGFKYNKTINDTQATYDAKLKLLSAGVIADIYPFRGKFRLSGGLYYNGNKFTLHGVPAAGTSYTFNGKTYTAAQVGSVNGSIDFNKFAPYLGFGWGNAVSSGSPFGFSLEVGAIYQGKPKTSLTTSITSAQLQRDIAVEKKKLDDAMNNFKFYPVIALGFNWRF